MRFQVSSCSSSAFLQMQHALCRACICKWCSMRMHASAALCRRCSIMHANACECMRMHYACECRSCIIISICIIMHRPDAAASRVSVRPVRCSRLACCPCCRSLRRRLACSMSGPSRSSSSAAPQPAAAPLLVEETYIEQGRTCICCTWIAAATPTCEHWSSVLVLPHRFEMQCMRTMCLSRSPTYT